MSERFQSFDGTELAVHRAGRGRPVLLLHGLFSSAQMNWIKFGHAQRLADAGFEAIMPDLRAHGDSAALHDPAFYPPGVLVRDVAALVAALGLDDFDLVGFSLGARTAAAAVMTGAVAPRRLVLAGVGLESLSNWRERAVFFVDTIDRFDDIRQGDPAYFTAQSGSRPARCHFDAHSCGVRRSGPRQWLARSAGSGFAGCDVRASPRHSYGLCYAARTWTGHRGVSFRLKA